MDKIIEHRLIDNQSIYIESAVWKEWCKPCKKFHFVTLQPCPDCGVHYTPQPKSEKVKDNCHASYICDGCEAYLDHY